MTHVPSDGIYPVMGLHPHVVGGISLTVTVRFIPYPAFPPYDVKKLHPGLRPTSATYMRNCYPPAMLTMIMTMTTMMVMMRKYLHTSWAVLGRSYTVLEHLAAS